MKNIKFLILSILFCFYSNFAFSEWKLFDMTNRSAFYIDENEIERKNNNIILWLMIDYIVKDEWNNNSMITYMEFDCINKRNRSNVAYLFSGRMGTGGVTDELLKKTEWGLPPPGSAYHRIMKKYC